MQVVSGSFSILYMLSEQLSSLCEAQISFHNEITVIAQTEVILA